MKNDFGWKIGKVQIFKCEIGNTIQFKEHFRIGPITGIKIFSTKNFLFMLTDK